MKWRKAMHHASWLIIVGAVYMPVTVAADPPDPMALIEAYTCEVPGYGVARLISDPTLDNLALAERIGGTGELVIYVRTELMKKFEPITRVFWLQHECSHHRLGHTKSSSAVPDACIAREEDAADCNAVQMMVNAPTPMIDVNGLSVIEHDLRRIPDGPGTIYKTGAQRAAQVDRCARDDAWAQRVIKAGNCAE